MGRGGGCEEKGAESREQGQRPQRKERAQWLGRWSRNPIQGVEEMEKTVKKGQDSVLDMDGAVTDNEDGDGLERKNVKLVSQTTAKGVLKISR